MGIDYGEKRVGIAVSDETNAVAFPKTVLENGPGIVGEIGRIAAENGVACIVLGESRNFAGEYNRIMEAALGLKASIERELGITVDLEPEFMTSAQAARQGETRSLDASAAALILQSYLDKKANKHDQHR